MDCPKTITIETQTNLKLKKSKKFNSKDENANNHEIKMGLDDNSIIFKAEINNGLLIKNIQVLIHLIN